MDIDFSFGILKQELMIINIIRFRIINIKSSSFLKKAFKALVQKPKVCSCPYSELASRFAGVDILCALKHLYDSLRRLHLEHLSFPHPPIRQGKLNDLREFWKLEIVRRYVTSCSCREKEE